MLTLYNWPRAIVHLDADAFFASCEQALHPHYRGKPLITGKERGIVACPSYEAKNRGVKRAMQILEAKKLCPEAIVVPSDYESYSLISKRMFAIMRKFTPEVEEYSIDEGFADLSGLRRLYRKSYEQIALAMKEAIEEELGISVSIGLSLSKSLAKLASEKNKPSGFTPLPGREIEKFLADTPINKIWGFGPNTTALLAKYGITNALEFVEKSQFFVKKLLGKIGVEIWQELRGEYVYPVDTKAKATYQSISKTKTFTPPSNDERFIYGQLARNLESACIKARRYKLLSRRIYIYLRRDDFAGEILELKLSRPSSYPIELAPLLHKGFRKLFNPQNYYRATGVILSNLISRETIQPTLFEHPLHLCKMEKTSQAIDKINQRFGKHTIHLAVSLPVNVFKQHQGDRGDIPIRHRALLPGETKRKRLKYPQIMVEV